MCYHDVHVCFLLSHRFLFDDFLSSFIQSFFLPLGWTLFGASHINSVIILCSNSIPYFLSLSVVTLDVWRWRKAGNASINAVSTLNVDVNDTQAIATNPEYDGLLMYNTHDNQKKVCKTQIKQEIFAKDLIHCQL